MQRVSHIVERYHPGHNHHAVQGLQREPPIRLDEQYPRTLSFFHVPRSGERGESVFSDALLKGNLQN